MYEVIRVSMVSVTEIFSFSDIEEAKEEFWRQGDETEAFVIITVRHEEVSRVLNTRMNDARYGTNPHWRSPNLPKGLGEAS